MSTVASTRLNTSTTLMAHRTHATMASTSSSVVPPTCMYTRSSTYQYASRGRLVSAGTIHSRPSAPRFHLSRRDSAIEDAPPSADGVRTGTLGGAADGLAADAAGRRDCATVEDVEMAAGEPYVGRAGVEKVLAGGWCATCCCCGGGRGWFWKRTALDEASDGVSACEYAWCVEVDGRTGVAKP